MYGYKLGYSIVQLGSLLNQTTEGVLTFEGDTDLLTFEDDVDLIIFETIE